MNKYELPAIEVSEITLEDVITASGITGGGNTGEYGGGGPTED